MANNATGSSLSNNETVLVTIPPQSSVLLPPSGGGGGGGDDDATETLIPSFDIWILLGIAAFISLITILKKKKHVKTIIRRN